MHEADLVLRTIDRVRGIPSALSGIYILTLVRKLGGRLEMENLVGRYFVNIVKHHHLHPFVKLQALPFVNGNIPKSVGLSKFGVKELGWGLIVLYKFSGLSLYI